MKPPRSQSGLDPAKKKAFKDGEKLEDYVQEYFFPPDLYEMIHRTPDALTNARRFVRSSTYPDFQFEVKGTRIRFWVECKLRSNKKNEAKIHVFKPRQLERYQNFDHPFLFLKTFYNDKALFYFAPIWYLTDDQLSLTTLKPYLITLKPPILHGLIKKYLFKS